MVKLTSIYELFDPRKPELAMYVGKGSEKRAQYHWQDFVRNNRAINRLVRRWFEKLRTDGVEPSYRIVAVVEHVKWETAEKERIAFWRTLNSELCNIANGGNKPDSTFQTCSLGGRLGGKKGGTTTQQRYPNLASEVFKRSWKLNREKMLLSTSIGGQAAAKLGRTGLQRVWDEKYEEMTKKAAVNAQFGGVGARKFYQSNPEYAKKLGQQKMHVRWYVNKNLWNLKTCNLCREEYAFRSDFTC